MYSSLTWLFAAVKKHILIAFFSLEEHSFYEAAAAVSESKNVLFNSNCEWFSFGSNQWLLSKFARYLLKHGGNFSDRHFEIKSLLTIFFSSCYNVIRNWIYRRIQLKHIKNRKRKSFTFLSLTLRLLLSSLLKSILWLSINQWVKNHALMYRVPNAHIPVQMGGRKWPKPWPNHLNY